jgi:uncharacterized protein YjbK
MQKLREIEYKRLVSRPLFLALMKRFGVGVSDAVEQVNHYFDTPDLALRRAGMAMRIREKGGKYGATLKVRERGAAAEFELEPLTRSQFLRIRRQGVVGLDWTPRLKAAGIDPAAVGYRGFLKTRRIVVPWEGGEICLDDNRYGRRRDYELEYEVVDARKGRRLFLKLLAEFGLEPDPHPVSKSHRALEGGGR